MNYIEDTLWTGSHEQVEVVLFLGWSKPIRSGLEWSGVEWMASLEPWLGWLNQSNNSDTCDYADPQYPSFIPTQELVTLWLYITANDSLVDLVKFI